MALLEETVTERGTALLVVTHDAALARSVAARVINLVPAGDGTGLRYGRSLAQSQP